MESSNSGVTNEFLIIIMLGRIVYSLSFCLKNQDSALEIKRIKTLH